MGKLEYFGISLDKEDGVYHIGQTVVASVVMHLSKPTKMTELKIRFIGRAEVEWTETETTGSGEDERTTTYTYSNHENYFDMKFSLWSQSSAGTSLHPAGKFTYPAHIVLPQNLPPSFEGSYGHVRYVVEAKIKKFWKSDQTTKRAFTVLAIMDLNANPAARTPFRRQENKMVCCCCCKSGPISVTLSLPKSGYVPGEKVLVTAEIKNNSSSSIKRAMATMWMEIKFRATSKSRSELKHLATIGKQRIVSQETYTWNNEPMPIPAVPASGLLACGIIDINYYLELEVSISMPCTKKMNMKAPLIIGTVPLSLNFASPPVPPGYPPTARGVQPPPSAPPVGLEGVTLQGGDGQGYSGYPPVLPSNAPVTPGPESPPPSYEECVVFGRANIKDKEDNDNVRGELEYSPRYTYYEGL